MTSDKGWENLKDGLAKRFTLEDGATVTAFIWRGDAKERVSFCADAGNPEQVESESGKLRSLSDVIELLRPEDIIEICCLTDKLSSTN